MKFYYNYYYYYYYDYYDYNYRTCMHIKDYAIECDIIEDCAM